MDPAIAAHHVSLRYGPVTAIEDLSIEIEPGTSTALVGPNGSGKTSLLRLIAGLDRPSAGCLDIDPHYEGAAFVLQHTEASRWMPVTVGEVITMGRYPGRGLIERLRPSDHAAIAQAAERLGVADLLGRQFSELSGGQRQRVLVAQAIVQERNLLLLDEPLTGLDLPSQDRILDIVASEAARGAVVVLSTHHLDEAQRCQQVVLLATRLIACGPPREVLTPEVLRVAYGHRVLETPDGSGAVVLDDHGHSHSP